MPTIGLLLWSRRRVPREDIERGQNGAGECQDRDCKIYGLCHARTLITASASAQTPIHNASTAIVPKATRPMPVIASLIGASSFCTRQHSLNAGTDLRSASTRIRFPLTSGPLSREPRTLTRWPLGTRFCRRKLAVSGQRFVSIRHVRRHLNRSIQCPLSGVKQTSVPPRNKVSAQSRHRSRSRTCITGKLGDLRVRSSPLTKASAWPPDKDLKKIRPSPAGNSASHFRQAIFARAEPRY